MLLAICAVCVSAAPNAQAHPMGTKFFGHRMMVTLAPEKVKLTYIVEIPVSKLILMMDRYKKKNDLDSIGLKEERAFNRDMQKYLISNIQFTAGGETRRMEWDPNYLSDQGAGEFRFFEYRIHLIADLSGVEEKSFPISILNENFIGQRAVFYDQVRSLPGVYATDSNIPPDIGWVEDPKYRFISAIFNRGPAPYGTEFSEKPSYFTGLQGMPLLTMLKSHELTIKVIAVAILTALFLGAVHALSPGHGKALVAAYLVGSRGTVWHAVWLGIIVTITHVFSVVVIGVVSLVAAQYVVPEYYMPFISLASGLLIVGIGIWLIIKRLRGRKVSAEHDLLDPAHSHDHAALRGDVTWRTLLTFGVTGGIVPCPSGMVVMLTAIAIGRIAFGLLLILFFSLGLAVVLTVVGIFAIKAERLLNRFSGTRLLTRWFPLASAIVITILGLAIIYQGFWVEWMMWR